MVCSKSVEGAVLEGEYGSDQENDQAKVIDFLSDPSSYPGELERIDRFETHGALVFLAGEEAWKIKRAVRFPYMDFSTLDKRRAATTRELEINQRLAPELYKDVVPITLVKEGRLQIGGSGEVVEWAVRMRRFDQNLLLSRIVDEGAFSTNLAVALADAVFESHQVAASVPDDAGAERVQNLIDSVGETLATLPDDFDASELQCFRERATDQLDRVRATLSARAATGFVRRCHGDLHLNNIVLWRGRPLLFDAIEFDEELATIDTLYDLAFLLMDLDKRSHRNLANLVLNRYLWHSSADLKSHGLEALPLFLGLRAAIRALVTAERAQQKPTRFATRDRQIARDYLSSAHDYLGPPAPRLIVVGGLSGTGKSTLARALAPELGPAPGAVHLRSDLERKRLYGVSETVRLAPEAYTQTASDAVYSVLYEKAREIVAARHAVIVDAVFAKSEERARIEAVAVELGVHFQGLWLTAGPEQLIERVAIRQGDASDATPEIVRSQLGWHLGLLSKTWNQVDASGSPEASIRNARAALALPLSAQTSRERLQRT
jgi:aminoglycoside phosphotransferase family enzyme/predicted kinase